MPNTPNIVIIGGGFAGLYAARELGNKPVHVTIVDRKNHHTFQPLLYQVATAGLSPGEIAAPIRSILNRYKNTEVLLGEVTGFDLARHRVLFRDEELGYDYLIVGSGATHAYFGHNEWAQYAPGLKSLEDATEIRRRILLAFELAERRARFGQPAEPLNFVIVGAGPTGVELAGTLVEIARTAIPRDFRAVDTSTARVILVEAGPRVLAAYPEDLSRSAEQQLKHLGVEVMTNTMVTGIGPDYVQMGNTRIHTAVALWSAGVAASSLGRKLVEAAASESPTGGSPIQTPPLVGSPSQAPSSTGWPIQAPPSGLSGANTLPSPTAAFPHPARLDRAGRVIVSPDLTLPSHPEVFVVGDLASTTFNGGKPVPGIAPAAIQMGQYAARTILGDIRGVARKPFAYHDKGTLATIGRKAAVGVIGKAHLTGFIAWLSWLLIHIYFLIGFKNRLLVLFDWAWAYFTYQRGARLITGNSNSIVPESAAAATIDKQPLRESPQVTPIDAPPRKVS